MHNPNMGQGARVAMMTALIVVGCSAGPLEHGDLIPSCDSCSPDEYGRYFAHATCAASASGLAACSTFEPSVELLDDEFQTIHREQGIGFEGRLSAVDPSGNAALFDKDAIRFVDHATGALRWSHDTSSLIFMSADNALVYAAPPGRIVAYRSDDGTELWTALATQLIAAATSGDHGVTAVGFFLNTVDFGGSTMPLTTTAQSAWWFAAFDPAGVATWACSLDIDPLANPSVTHIAVGPGAEVGFAGKWQGPSITIGPHVLTQASSSSVGWFVATLDPATCGVRWAKSVGPLPEGRITSLLTDGTGLFVAATHGFHGSVRYIAESDAGLSDMVRIQAGAEGEVTDVRLLALVAPDALVAEFQTAQGPLAHLDDSFGLRVAGFNIQTKGPGSYIMRVHR
jgi:hypothetical protein